MIDCGAYFIFPVIDAALIRERRLYESGAYSRAPLISTTGKSLRGI